MTAAGAVQRALRLSRLLATAALLVLGAAGLTGYLYGEDHCSLIGTKEGTSSGSTTGWSPPGLVCIVQEPSGTGPDGRFAYADPPRRIGHGSWPAFLLTLAAGALLVGSAVRRRPVVLAWLRLLAAVVLAFAVAGAGAFLALAQGAAFFGVVAGVPLAVLAERRLRRGRPAGPPFVAAAGTAAVTLVALVLGWVACFS